MRKAAEIVILAGLLFALPAHADTIQYSASGMFSPSTASSAFSGPSDTWAFSFQIDRNPKVSNPGQFSFDPAFSNSSYLLNGSPAITPTFVRFFTTDADGVLVVCFNVALHCSDGFELNLGAPQLFTLPTSAPTMLTGAFTAPWDVVVKDVPQSQPGPAGTITIDVVPTHEPSSAFLFGTGLLGLMSMSGFARLRKQVSTS